MYAKLNSDRRSHDHRRQAAQRHGSRLHWQSGRFVGALALLLSTACQTVEPPLAADPATPIDMPADVSTTPDPAVQPAVDSPSPQPVQQQPDVVQVPHGDPSALAGDWYFDVFSGGAGGGRVRVAADGHVASIRMSQLNLNYETHEATSPAGNAAYSVRPADASINMVGGVLALRWSIDSEYGSLSYRQSFEMRGPYCAGDGLMACTVRMTGTDLHDGSLLHESEGRGRIQRMSIAIPSHSAPNMDGRWYVRGDAASQIGSIEFNDRNEMTAAHINGLRMDFVTRAPVTDSSSYVEITYLPSAAESAWDGERMNVAFTIEMMAAGTSSSQSWAFSLAAGASGATLSGDCRLTVSQSQAEYFIDGAAILERGLGNQPAGTLPALDGEWLNASPSSASVSIDSLELDDAGNVLALGWSGVRLDFTTLQSVAFNGVQINPIRAMSQVDGDTLACNMAFEFDSTGSGGGSQVLEIEYHGQSCSNESRRLDGTLRMFLPDGNGGRQLYREVPALFITACAP